MLGYFATRGWAVKHSRGVVFFTEYHQRCGGGQRLRIMIHADDDRKPVWNLNVRRKIGGGGKRKAYGFSRMCSIKRQRDITTGTTSSGRLPEVSMFGSAAIIDGQNSRILAKCVHPCSANGRSVVVTVCSSANRSEILHSICRRMASCWLCLSLQEKLAGMWLARRGCSATCTKQ